MSDRQPQTLRLDAAKVYVLPAWEEAVEGEAIAIERETDDPAERDQVILTGSIDTLRAVAVTILSLCDDLEE